MDKKKFQQIWYDNPIMCVGDVFGYKPDPWQLDVLDDLSKYNRVSIRSGHGVGKSSLLSMVIWWMLLTRFPCKVPVAAPTMHQLRDVLWSELALWHRRMPRALQQLYKVNNSVTDLRIVNLEAGDACYAVGRTGRKENPDALQGFHSDNLLYVIDESPGVDDIIFQVAGSALTGANAKVIMAGNPTRNSGYFYDSHHRNRHLWQCKHISSEDSHRVSKGWIESMAEEYGPTSNVYRVRVQGEFPEDEPDVLIQLSLVEPALTREVEAINVRPIWGLDVGEMGECPSALAKRKGNVLMEKTKVIFKRDPAFVADWVANEFEDTPAAERPSEIIVDKIGYGSGVVANLRRLKLPVIGLNVGELPSARDRFKDKKTELWWRTMEWFAGRDVNIADDRQLAGQLVSAKYTDMGGRVIKMVDKRTILKAGMKIDRADGFVLTFAGREVLLDKDYSGGRRRKRAAYSAMVA